MASPLRHFPVRISAAPISQRDLESIRDLEAQINKLTKLRDRLAVLVIRDMIAGRAVEAGRREPHIVEEWDGCESRRRLIIE